MAFITNSARHSLKLIRFFLEKNDTERSAEPIHQLFRDLYFKVHRNLPKESLVKYAPTLGLNLSEEELAELGLIEQNVRQEERYLKMCTTLQSNILISILNKIEVYLKTSAM